MERMSKPKFIKEIEKFEGKERVECGRWYIRVYGELDHKPMVELESLEIVVKEFHKLEEENKNLKLENVRLKEEIKTDESFEEKLDNENKELREKNKKLKSDLAFERAMLDNVGAEYDSLQAVNEKLKEKVETLELWLDNKEKLNEEYRKQIDKLRTDNVYEEGLYE